MLTRMLFVGLVAGAIAGVVAAGVQSMLIQPLIVQAEASELAAAGPAASHLHAQGAVAHEHEHGDDEEPSDDPRARSIATAVALACTGIGYGLIVSGVLALARQRGWRAGLMLGVVGFVSVQLAPALGMPPVPPGGPDAELHARQAWWLLAATCTGPALLLGIRSARKRHAAGLASALGLLALPHVLRRWWFELGPPPDGSALSSPFVLMSLANAAVLWLCLGTVAGALYARSDPRR